MNINAERLLSQFITLVSTDSPSYGERQVCDYITKRLRSVGMTVSEDDAGQRLSGNCGNLYGYLPGNIVGKPLLFCAHMDTVEPSQGKQAHIGEDGVIRSGGTTVLGADDCSGIAAVLEALNCIQEQSIPHRPIEVLFTVAEETYSMGAKQFDFSRIQSKEAYVLDLTGPVGLAAYQAPSIVLFEATITGKAAHAGFAPESGIHAIAAAAEAVSRLHMGRIGEDTTFNIGRIEGGTVTNIVPDRCVIKGEIRSFSHERALLEVGRVETCFKQTARKFGASMEFQVSVGCEAYETPLESGVALRFSKACRRLGIDAGLVKTFGGSDNNTFEKNGITGIVMACAMNACHSLDEYTSIGDLCKAAELTAALMTEPD